jgi:NADPH:quinone reductase-like Zn-dependent oxidoreductase
MRVMQVIPSGKSHAIAPAEMPIPTPGDNEVLIRVHAAGVTPTELVWYPTTHTAAGEPRTFAVPGHEFSGTLVQVGRNVEGFAAGDAVFGMNDWFIDGATAEYCLAKPDSIALKPSSISHEEAASIPISALTAWQGLFTKANLQAGNRVLVQGGAGGVGIFVVQFASQFGASVVATASAASSALLRELGAQMVIDYKTSRFEDIVHDIDLVFDTVGGEALNRSWSVLKPGGRVVTIAADAEGRPDQRIKDAFFIVEQDGNELHDLSERIEAGQLRTFVNAIVPFEEAPAAYANTLRSKAGYGKVVLTISQPE